MSKITSLDKIAIIYEKVKSLTLALLPVEC